MFDPLRTLAALILEAAVGYPARLDRAIPHPVNWAGNAISWFELRWNRPAWSDASRRLLGVLTLLIVAGVPFLAGGLIDHLAASRLWALALTVAVATTGLAQRSLYQHVHAVGAALGTGDLRLARLAVGRIVGRDVDRLEEAGIATAALESLAESFCDGVIAPVFWFLFSGLAGLFAYKVVNTADSLIGHIEPRWRQFGWAAARCDDALNFFPARLSGALLALAGAGGWRVMISDARKHASPNAGWPEAAMAGALGVRLGGPVHYDGKLTARPWFGTGRAPVAADIKRGLRIYLIACGILWALLAAGALAWRH